MAGFVGSADLSVRFLVFWQRWTRTAIAAPKAVALRA
jgi:hypothetical protein